MRPESPKMNFILKFAAIFFIAVNLIISFEQYYTNGLDGDVVRVNQPDESFLKTFEDPLGIRATIYHESYGGAGRWFCYFAEYHLFHEGFYFINYFADDKIESLFLAPAIFQWLCQWILILVLAFYVNIQRKVSWWNILFSAALIIPFFQFGYCLINVGIINHSITYTIFYAFPVTMLLIFFYPFFRKLYYENTNFSKSIFQITAIILLALLIVFSSPLIAPLGIIFGGILLLLFFLRSGNSVDATDSNNIYSRIKKIPVTVRILIPVFMLLCLYDFYVGRFNSENETGPPLAQRYLSMLNGIPDYLINFGLPYCFGLLILVYFFVRKYFHGTLKTKKFNFLKLLSLGVILFLFLLPFGGYRSYRPHIWSSDLTMPLTLFLIITIVSGALYLLHQLSKLSRSVFAFLFFTTLFIYWLQNFPVKNSRMEQQQMLEILSQQKNDDPVCLHYSSPLLAWNKIESPASSYLVSDFLYSLGITQKKILFYQK